MPVGERQAVGMHKVVVDIFAPFFSNLVNSFTARIVFTMALAQMHGSLSPRLAWIGSKDSQATIQTVKKP